jgi:hypothetical protein
MTTITQHLRPNSVRVKQDANTKESWVSLDDLQFELELIGGIFQDLSEELGGQRCRNKS